MLHTMRGSHWRLTRSLSHSHSTHPQYKGMSA